jgi:hypothetical protein
MGWDYESEALATYILKYNEDESSELHLTWFDTASGTRTLTVENGVLPELRIQLIAAVNGLVQWLGVDDSGYLYLFDIETNEQNRLSDINWPDSASLLDVSGRLKGEVVSSGQIISWSVLPANNLDIGACAP